MATKRRAISIWRSSRQQPGNSHRMPQRQADAANAPAPEPGAPLADSFIPAAFSPLLHRPLVQNHLADILFQIATCQRYWLTQRLGGQVFR